MKKLTTILLVFSLYSTYALAAPASLSVKIRGIDNNKPISEDFAFCKPDGKGMTEDGGNENPEIRWSGAPKGTKSFAIIMVDHDVPAKFDDANQKGKTIAAEFPRQDFYHWVLVDIPADRNEIAITEDSSGHQAGGKPVGKRGYGIVGQNDFATFMKGSFGGYDGPCPPWNDERVHRYHFQVYALNTPSLGLKGTFNGKQAMAVIEKHTIAKGEVVGTFTNKQ